MNTKTKFKDNDNRKTIMKNLWLYNSVIFISLITSVSVQAAPINSTFSSGDTLTAEKMNEIKGAVNDNDTRTTANISNISSNSSGISTNLGSIGTNTGNITSNTSAIGVNTGNISTNSGNITTNTTGISTNAGNITSNSSGISTNSGNISTNTGNISTNSANIGDNTSSTAINEADISTNTTAISNMFGGDGSAGDLLVSASLDWNSSPPTNPSFANITIDVGQTLTVPAGTTIRCSGTFINNGTVTVSEGAKMASINNFAFGATPDIFSYGHPGDSFRPASSGAYYTDGVANPKFIQGGMGGDAIPKATTYTSFNSFRIGAGSGSGYRNPANAGAGGGLIKIYCDGGIINAGTINANGNSPSKLSGGGGGGIVIIASSTSIDNSAGTINANGGNGGSSFAFSGAGGGGGGGIVAFVAPIIGTGTVNLNGGTGGDTTIQVTNKHRFGGGAGGASGGNGGDGSDIPSTATATATTPNPGVDGYSIEINSNPAYLLN